MRTLLVGFSVALFVSIALQAQAQIAINEDEFTGEVTIKSESPKLIKAEGDDVIRAYFATAYSDPHFLIGIHAISNEDIAFNYNTDNAYFLLDGDRLRLSVANTETEYQDGNIRSSVMITMSKEDYKSFTKATEVRTKINNHVFTIPLHVRRDMLLILEEVNSN